MPADTSTSSIKPARSHRRYRLFIGLMFAATVVVAALLRFVGLGFGHGVLVARPDEELVHSAVLTSLTGDLNPHYAVWGHLFHYLYLTAASVWTFLRVTGGTAASWTDAVAAAHCEPLSLMTLGRAVSATAGVLTLVATYHLARRSLQSRIAAISSCVILSTLFLHVRDSHFATCDVLLGLFSTAALAAMAKPGNTRFVWAGIWTGLALASKLLAVTVGVTFLTLLVISRRSSPKDVWSGRLRAAFGYGAVAVLIALVTQPFLVLDPMETWYGLFGDLFNPERVPLEQGLSWQNGAILVRYYVPQAMGWLVAGFALVGGVSLLPRLFHRPSGVLLVYCFWSVLAVLSVQRIFLRYLDPLLPVIAVLASRGIEVAWHGARRWLRPAVHEARSGRGSWLATGRVRAGFIVVAAIAIALPNLIRSIWLDIQLQRRDTRALARDWIVHRIGPNSRILWAGYGAITPELTMPFLHPPAWYIRDHIAVRESRDLDTSVDNAILQWHAQHDVPTFALVGLSFGSQQRERPGFEAHPFLEHHYELPWLERLAIWSREAGLLRRESPRWELKRRHVTAALETTPTKLAASGEEWIALTGMPIDLALVRALGETYTEVFRAEPGLDWTEYTSAVMYDLGDCWFVPNWGLHRIERPGPEVRIFKRRTEVP